MISKLYQELIRLKNILKSEFKQKSLDYKVVEGELLDERSKNTKQQISKYMLFDLAAAVTAGKQIKFWYGEGLDNLRYELVKPK